MKTGFKKIVKRELGERPPQAQYSYKDEFTSFTANCLAGGSCAEDLNILKNKQPSKAGTYCSSDTFTRVIKQWIDMDHMYLKESEQGTETEFFYNEPLNRLLLQSFKQYFSTAKYKVLDHDHTKIITNKPDAKTCYKGKGYYASFFSADQIPMYVWWEITSDRKCASNRFYFVCLHSRLA